MSIESTIASAAQGVVASAAESAASSVASSVVGTAVSAATASFNPLAYIKMAGYAALVAGALFVGLKFVNFCQQAAADHAAVATLTTQRDQAIQTANDNAAAKIASDRQHEDVVSGATAAKAKAEAENADLKAANKELQDEQNVPAPVCVPTAGESAVISGLRKPTAAGANNRPAAKPRRVGG